MARAAAASVGPPAIAGKGLARKGSLGAGSAARPGFWRQMLTTRANLL